MMKTSPYLIAALLALAPPTLGAEGDWPMCRHDPALTGFQPTLGAMAEEPRVLARHSLGASPGTATFADLLGSGSMPATSLDAAVSDHRTWQPMDQPDPEHSPRCIQAARESFGTLA
jgi:hypothetical protein